MLVISSSVRYSTSSFKKNCILTILCMYNGINLTNTTFVLFKVLQCLLLFTFCKLVLIMISFIIINKYLLER